VDGGQYATTIALPYIAYQSIPGLGMIRTPGRMNLVTAVALAALAAYGWAVLSDRIKRLHGPIWQSGAVILLTAVVMMEYQLYAPFPTTAVTTPAYFEQLAEAAGRGEVHPVLNLPSEDFFVKLWMLYDQTIHHQPVIAGHVIRKSPANPAMIDLVNEAARPQQEHGFLPAMTPEQQAAVIRLTGADVVAVHRRYGEGSTMAAHLVEVLGPPAYEDDRLTIFEVPDGPPLDSVPYAVFGGWTVGSVVSERWLSAELTLSYYLPEARVGYWEFGADGWLYDRWLALDLLPGQPEFYLVPEDADGQVRYRSSRYTLPAGFQQVRFWVERDVAEGCTIMPGEGQCRSVLIQTPRLVLEDAPTLDVDFDGKMRLVDVDIERVEPGRYDLNFYWQALGSERADYTMFVHLLTIDGEPVTQWDGPIGGLDMPTSRWPENGLGYQQAVIAFDEESLEPGVYQLFAGLYTYPDITRLPVQTDGPRAQEMLLYLQDIVIPSSDAE
jgi:hypothetical protein